MPFKSENQRRYMWKKHPDIAKRWADEGKGYVAKRGKSRKAVRGKSRPK